MVIELTNASLEFKLKIFRPLFPETNEERALNERAPNFEYSELGHTVGSLVLASEALTKAGHTKAQLHRPALSLCLPVSCV